MPWIWIDICFLLGMMHADTKPANRFLSVSYCWGCLCIVFNFLWSQIPIYSRKHLQQEFCRDGHNFSSWAEPSLPQSASGVGWHHRVPSTTAMSPELTHYTPQCPELLHLGAYWKQGRAGAPKSVSLFPPRCSCLNQCSLRQPPLAAPLVSTPLLLGYHPTLIAILCN